MPHDCSECKETFETLTALRLHDCSATENDDDEAAVDDWLEDRGQKRRREREQLAERIVAADFAATIEEARSGDPAAAAMALAQYGHELEAALDREDDGDAYRAVFWTYYDPVVEALDAIARTEGWPFILDIAAAYDHRQEGLTDQSAVTTNLVARNVIRTRLTADVASIPVDALEYLAAVPKFDTDTFEIAWEESQHLGWAIGHPEYPIEKVVREHLPKEDVWAGAVAFRALYADQRAGVSLYCDVLREAEEVAFVLDRLAHVEDEPDWSIFPRGWDATAEFDRDFTITLEEGVESQLRATIEEIGYSQRLPDEWTFEDLELRWG